RCYNGVTLRLDASTYDAMFPEAVPIQISARLELPSGFTPLRQTSFTRTCYPVGGDEGDGGEGGWLVLDLPLPSRFGQEELPYVRSFLAFPARSHGFSRVISLEIGLIYKKDSQTQSDPNYDGTNFWSSLWFWTLSRECQRRSLHFSAGLLFIYFLSLFFRCFIFLEHDQSRFLGLVLSGI
ncbi:unnamed protein product, partial [Brassica oleracea]